MKSGDCFVIVYSVTDRLSFQEAQSIYEFTKRIRDTDMPVVSYIATVCVCMHVCRCVCVCVCVCVCIFA